jgi:hypothetical protein
MRREESAEPWRRWGLWLSGVCVQGAGCVLCCRVGWSRLNIVVGLIFNEDNVSMHAEELMHIVFLSLMRGTLSNILTLN